jgi:glycerol-3-phosphate dehydrogenase
LTGFRPGPETSFDVVVIGAGALGAAIALRLSETCASVCLVEREDDVCEGSSKGNAGIMTTYYAPPGTLEAELIADSWPRWEEICGRLDVPFERIGSLTVALDDEQAAQLPGLHDDAVRAGAVNARLADAEATRELEPMVSADARGSLVLPDEGIIDPMRLVWAYAELAAANGAEILLASPVTGFRRTGAQLTCVGTTRGEIGARFVVNAAGLAAGSVSELAGGERIDVTPRKGQYWILDRAFGERLSRLVLPVPMPHTRGIQVARTTNRSVLLGPDAADTSDDWDRATDLEALDEVFASARRLVPEISLEHAIKTYAANRASTGAETMRLRLDPDVPNLVQVGNRSTGVSCSPAIAERVLRLLRDEGLDAPERDDAVRALAPTRRLLLDDDPESLDQLDPRYRQVVCACEDVTAAEIDAALTARVPARSIEGVRKRTRATGGRCQGSVCMAGVAFLCTLRTGSRPDQVRIGSHDATLGVGCDG